MGISGESHLSSSDEAPEALNKAERVAFDRVISRAREYARAYYGDNGHVMEGDWQEIKTRVGAITVAAIEVFDDRNGRRVRGSGLFIVPNRSGVSSPSYIQAPRNTLDVSDALHAEIL